MIFDTHTHLNLEEFAGRESEVIEKARKMGVTEMAVVGFDEPTIKRALELKDQFQEVYAIIGWHPTDAGTYSDGVETRLREWLQGERVVGVGETGLDYYWDTAPHDVQKEVFARQIALSKEVNKPFIVHNRDATEDVYEVIKSERVGPAQGVMHSFNLGPEWAKRFLDLGMYISFSGVLTFKNTSEIRETAKYVPLDRILVETDAPYLAPEPKRGRRNEPGYTRYVAECLAEVRGISLEEIAEITTKNAHRLFHLN